MFQQLESSYHHLTSFSKTKLNITGIVINMTTIKVILKKYHSLAWLRPSKFQILSIDIEFTIFQL